MRVLVARVTVEESMTQLESFVQRPGIQASLSEAIRRFDVEHTKVASIGLRPLVVWKIFEEVPTIEPLRFCVVAEGVVTPAFCLSTTAGDHMFLEFRGITPESTVDIQCVGTVLEDDERGGTTIAFGRIGTSKGFTNRIDHLVDISSTRLPIGLRPELIDERIEGNGTPALGNQELQDARGLVAMRHSEGSPTTQQAEWAEEAGRER
jgi:hypothetical protein